ncbi:MAG: hypothetical protein AB8B95_12980 [Pseudohongiellaceae bacterium]
MRVFSFWKSVFWGMIPTAVLYQLLWSLFFKNMPSQFWVDGTSTQYLFTKSAGEILMYSLMLWFAVARTERKSAASLLVVCGLLGFTVLYTAYSLFHRSFF